LKIKTSIQRNENAITATHIKSTSLTEGRARPEILL